MTLISWEAEHPERQIGRAFIDKNPYYQHITYGLQSDWLHVCKAILLVQLRGLLFKLRRPRAFQLSRGLLLGAYWLAGSRSPDGGGEPHHFTETETQVPAACQPQPRQPHIIKLISQLQKPTRKISDTRIIDTGKRETRYQLVKVHQTVRQPHTTSS